MIPEIQGTLDAAEKTKDLYDLRIHLTVLERSQNYFTVDDWRRYQEIAKAFRERIIKTFGVSMGS